MSGDGRRRQPISNNDGQFGVAQRERATIALVEQTAEIGSLQIRRAITGAAAYLDVLETG